MGDSEDRETSLRLDPRFDAAGLITAVVVDSLGAPLMVAMMDRGALDATLRDGRVHFFSRSRGRLWMKGETSGNVLRWRHIRIDCDQDALWIVADAAGPACHTGAESCFYRELKADGTLETMRVRDGRAADASVIDLDVHVNGN